MLAGCVWGRGGQGKSGVWNDNTITSQVSSIAQTKITRCFHSAAPRRDSFRGSSVSLAARVQGAEGDKPQSARFL